MEDTPNPAAESAARAEAIIAITKTRIGDDDQTALIDLLVDLRHWADAHGITWANADQASQNLHIEEVGVPYLCELGTGDAVRPATPAEVKASADAIREDGGFLGADGRTYFVI
jgi:hypothetical protein